MVNYSNSKIYFIRRQDTDEVIWCGGTVSSLKRRYYNHVSNKKDVLHQIVQALEIDWGNLKIEMIKDYNTCRDRKRLKFAADIALLYYRHNNDSVYHAFLDNLEYYIE
jgi:hypothetical protein